MRNNTYFISDLHLGAGYISDTHAHERMIVKWLRSIAPTARTIYMLGDVLDYWYEYRYVVPRGFTRFFGAIAELVDAGVEIVWLKGNHDIWIYDYLPAELGITVADGVIERTIDGKRFVMEHGDGVGEPRKLYQIMRRVFRNRFAQVLYSAIHPRWTVGLAHRWSRHSRIHGYSHTEGYTPLPDSDPLVEFARNYNAAHNQPADFFIFGHRHILVDRTIDHESRIIVLGDSFRHLTYGVWNGSEFSMHKYENAAEMSELKFINNSIPTSPHQDTPL